jgi:hypothetical protein
MLKIVRLTLYVFIAIVAATATLVLAGLAYLWFFSEEATRQDLPYLKGLVTALILEIIAVVITLARKGFRYLPNIEHHKTENETLAFLKKFISGGSTVQIVSSRLAWIKNSPELLREVERLARNGVRVEVITPMNVADDIRLPLIEAGVHFYRTNEDAAPEARFTLINGNRSGAERLAIACGSHPDHEVSIFDNNSGPQIIGMAKDIIRKSKGLADAA